LSKQTIIITGITGFIGQRVTEYFLNQDFFVIAPVRSYKSGLSKRKNLLLCKYEKLESIVFKRKIEYIFHFASLTSVNHSDQNLIYKTNINLANLISKLAKKCNPRMIVFTSTISVYGEVLDSFLSFDTQINEDRVDAYGQSKLIAENILTNSSINNKFRLVVFRLPGVIGYGSHSNLISKVIKTLLSENPEPLNLINPKNLFNNIIDINTFISYLNKLISPNYKDFEQIKTVIACKEPMKIIDVTKLIIRKMGLDESNSKKIIWKLSKLNSFTIDSNYQKKFLFQPISTNKCISNICQDMLNSKN
tara:strand:- start:4138 stop:5055 length:918 start_codon:yes stop_codon:yes gene_type:complete